MEIIEPAGLSVTAAADALQVSRPALSSLLNRRASLSGEMALRIEKAFGVKMDTLMGMQSAYEIAQTRKREKETHVRRIARLAPALRLACYSRRRSTATERPSTRTLLPAFIARGRPLSRRVVSKTFSKRLPHAPSGRTKSIAS